MDRLDSQAIIGLFKTTENNLLDFDGLEEFLDFNEQDELLPMPDLVGVLGADLEVEGTAGQAPPLLAGGGRRRWPHSLQPAGPAWAQKQQVAGVA